MITLLAIAGAWLGLAVIYYGTWVRFGGRIDESMVQVLVEHGHRLPGASGSPERKAAARHLVTTTTTLWALLSPGAVLFMAWWVTR